LPVAFAVSLMACAVSASISLKSSLPTYPAR
jgi:hypothetical protein